MTTTTHKATCTCCGIALLCALLSACDDGRDWDAAFARAEARRVQYARDICAPNPVKSYDGDVVVCYVESPQ